MKATPKPSEVRTPQLVQVQFLADYGQHKKGDTALLPESEAQVLPSHAAHVLGTIPQSAIRNPQ